MKNNPMKHVLAALLVFCMVLTMLPVGALAVENVTPTPAQNGAAQIPVEYFTSTLYNWNENGANNATAAADWVETDTRAETHVQWSVANYYGVNQWIPVQYYFYAGYAVKVNDRYYPAYGKWENDAHTRASLYYKTDGGNPEGFYQDQVDGGLTYVTTYDVEDYGAYITDPTGKFATETVDGQENVVIFYGASENGYYAKKGFYFTNGAVPGVFNGSKANYPAFSLWVDRDGKEYSKQEFHIYSGLAAQDLSESKNVPFDNENVNAADLFSTTEYSWKDVYQNVSVPFYVDEDGYYVLDSDKYGVYFTNGVNADRDESTMAIADLPSHHDGKTGFVPFNTLGANKLNKAAQLSTSNTKVDAYPIQEGTVFGFGMVTEVKFQMTDDGLDKNGEPITFEFAGDDDVWVYIDNKLVLDVGGTHGAIKGTVNFVTGEVHLSSPLYGPQDIDNDGTKNGVGDYTTGVEATNNDLQQQNLYGTNGALGTTLTGFSAQGEHTLKIYYMERGRTRSNCLIRFNLPQRDTVEVTKKLDHAMSDKKELSDLDPREIAIYNAREFGFTLFEDGESVANKTYYVYDSDNNLLHTASTNAAGHFTLHRNETARFLVDIGTNNSFYVVEDEMTKEKDGFLTPTWTYTTNVAGAKATAETVNGFTGMTVTATGTYTGTKADTISFVCENYLSSNIPNPGILPQGERIVIDYGLPITINVSDLLANDIIRGNETTFSLAVIGENDAVTKVTNVNGAFGTAVYNDVGNDGDYTNDTITYTLNKQLTGIETLTYAITVTGKGNEGNEETSETATANVQIMPATSMYYEENFGGISETARNVTDAEGKVIASYYDSGLVSYSAGATVWGSVGTANGGNQETGFVGTIGDSTYGSDTVYLTGTGDSYGTSMKASAKNESDPTKAKAAQFVYDFTGTGTAIYGRVSAATGYIRVVVTKADGTVVDRQYIDTVEIAKVGTAEELYNIPIYLNNTFAHGTYHVEVMLYQVNTPTPHGKSGADFYLDGIRIYNPVVNNATVNTAYADDGEANTVVLNIRNKILGDNKDGYLLNTDFFTLTDVNGKVIENEDGTTTTPGGDTEEVADYAAYGPDNEFYLNNENTENDIYTVSFKLINWNTTYSLYIGMKAPAGNASVKVGDTTIQLNNSTDCYYDISEYVSVSTENGYSVGTVTISGNQGLASLTNIKVTGTEKFALGTAADWAAQSDNPTEGGPNGDNGNAGANTRMLYMVPMTFSLNEDIDEIIPDETIPDETVPDETVPDETAPDETVPDETVPDETVPEETVPGEEKPADAFAPRYFRVDCSYIRLFKSATIMVTASSDVSYITVDGARVSGISLLGTKVFVCTEGQVRSGETFEVIAYNSDGVASVSCTVTAK